MKSIEEISDKLSKASTILTEAYAELVAMHDDDKRFERVLRQVENQVGQLSTRASKQRRRLRSLR